MSLALAVVLAVLLVAGDGGAVSARHSSRPTTITAYFTTATGIYPGDEVRVSGVKVGTIAAIEPQGTRAKMTLDVDRGVPIPADAKAVIVAQNLVSARYVQLTPAYETSGPTMADGAVIPVDRTAVPVEWDEVKTQLMRLATDLGPNRRTCRARRSAGSSTAPPTRWTATATSCAQTLAQLSGVGRILADGSGNIVDIIKNLQTFVTALRDSNDPDRAVPGSAGHADQRARRQQVRSRCGADESVAAPSARCSGSSPAPATRPPSRSSGWPTSRRTWSTTSMDLENVLHVAPNAFANGYNIYNPDTGTVSAAFVLNNFSNPVAVHLCGDRRASRTSPRPKRRSCARSTSVRRCGC